MYPIWKKIKITLNNGNNNLYTACVCYLDNITCQYAQTVLYMDIGHKYLVKYKLMLHYSNLNGKLVCFSFFIDIIVNQLKIV